MSYDIQIVSPIEVPDLDVNITYNVSTMLRRAGLHPHVLDGMTVRDARPVVGHAHKLMKDHPHYFSTLNAQNGWGTYETTLEAVGTIRRALVDVPEEQLDLLRLRWQ